MKTMLKRVLIAAATLVAGSAVAAQDLPQMRAAVLESGTVNWELTTITGNGFDKANGFELVMQPYADNAATRIALEGGEADMVVADWIWVARQRAEGKPYVFVPYSKAVGGLMVTADSPAETLADLKGQKIGIAGGPVDKSWLILRAYAEQEYGLDLAAETEQVFGAPPLIMKAGLSGETQGSINFWHFQAKMSAAGMRELISVEAASEALGLDPDIPLLGYVLKEDYVAAHPGIAKALITASRNAKALLATDAAAWDAIRPMMNAADDAQFVALKEGFIAGTPPEEPVDEAGADQLLQLMAKLGGEELVGKATTLPAGLFAATE